jgi:hypothetical protein
MPSSARNGAGADVEQSPEEGRFFKMIWDNRKYRLFKILTRKEGGLWPRGWKRGKAFQEGDLETAERLATDVVRGDEKKRKSRSHSAARRLSWDKGFPIPDRKSE